MSSIDVCVITERKAQWVEISTTLRKRVTELTDELGVVQGQLAQLSGAIQACDVLLAANNSETHLDVATVDNNG